MNTPLIITLGEEVLLPRRGFNGEFSLPALWFYGVVVDFSQRFVAHFLLPSRT